MRDTFSNNMSFSNAIKQIVSFGLVLIFTFFSLNPIGWAQTVLLPPAGTIANLGVSFTPALLRGVAVNPLDPLKLNFIIDQADCPPDQFSQESQKLIKYFLAAFTIPEKDLWVNLSPDAPERIIPQSLGVTDMGKDLLTQDYFLKHLSSSLMSPENALGKKFWEKIYQQTKEKYGTTDIPISTLSRVWIVPDEAVLVEFNTKVFVVKSRLKVMLEEEYLKSAQRSLISDQKNKESANSLTTDHLALTTQMTKDLIIPTIEEEVNTGKNFAELRQIYQAFILAKWYKNRLKESFITQAYADQNKVNGIDLANRGIPQEVYDQYIKNFEQGAYEYIREEYNAETQAISHKKFVSGGMLLAAGRVNVRKGDLAMAAEVERNFIKSPTDLEIRIQPITNENSSASVKPEVSFDAAMMTEAQKIEYAKKLYVEITLAIDYKDNKRELNALKRLKKFTNANLSLPNVLNILKKAEMDYANGLYEEMTFRLKNPRDDDEALSAFNNLSSFAKTNKSSKIRHILEKAKIDYANGLYEKLRNQVPDTVYGAKVLLDKLKSFAQKNTSPKTLDIIEKAKVYYANRLYKELRAHIAYNDQELARIELKKLQRFAKTNESSKISIILERAKKDFQRKFKNVSRESIGENSDRSDEQEMALAGQYYEKIKELIDKDDLNAASAELETFKQVIIANGARLSMIAIFRQATVDYAKQIHLRISQHIKNGALSDASVQFNKLRFFSKESQNSEISNILSQAYDDVVRAEKAKDRLNNALDSAMTSAPGGIDLSLATIRFEGVSDIQMLNPPASLDPAAMIGFMFQIQNIQPITNLQNYLMPLR